MTDEERAKYCGKDRELSVVGGRERGCWDGWGLLRISQKNRILGCACSGATPPPKKTKKKKQKKKTNKNPPNATVRLLKKQREKKVKTLNQRERPSYPSLWPVGTTPPTLQKKQGRLKKKKKKKPVDERLQGKAHFSESFAPSMEPHSGLGLISHF